MDNTIYEKPVDPSLITRRGFITTTASLAASMALSASSLQSFINPPFDVRAVAFDAFPIFDPRPVFNLVRELYPEKGMDLSELWRTKQFEYSWLRTAAGKYKNFWEVTEDALVFAAKKTGVELSPTHKDQLMQKYLSLHPWPDVLPALKTMKQKGLRLCFLSNMTTEMLKSSSKASGIEEYFEEFISTDLAKTYKPSARAYQLGIDHLKLKKQEIMFVAFAGWDASGSKWFGYPTFWVNRLGTPVEELNAIPDGTGNNMSDLMSFMKI